MPEQEFDPTSESKHMSKKSFKDLGNPVTWKSDDSVNQPEFLMCRSNSEAVGPGIQRIQTIQKATSRFLAFLEF